MNKIDISATNILPKKPTNEENIDGIIERFLAGDVLSIPGGREYRHKSKALNGIVRLIFLDNA